MIRILREYSSSLGTTSWIPSTGLLVNASRMKSQSKKNIPKPSSPPLPNADGKKNQSLEKLKKKLSTDNLNEKSYMKSRCMSYESYRKIHLLMGRTNSPKEAYKRYVEESYKRHLLRKSRSR